MQQLPFVCDYTDYPLIPIKFFYKTKETPCIDALLDSGGDFIVIPMAIAKYLSLKLERAGQVDTAGGATELFKANVDMDMLNEKQKISYKNLEIHVSTRNDIPVLLGRSPIFEDHEIIFKKQENQVILYQVKK